MKRNHHFCSSRRVPKSSWGALGGILSAFWKLPGGLGSVLRRLGSVLVLLGCSWTSFGASGTFQKHSKSVPGSSKRPSQTLQDTSKIAPDGFRGVLGASWKHIARKPDFSQMYEAKSPFLLLPRTPKNILGASWRYPGGLLEASCESWRCLGASWKRLGALGALLEVS